MLLRHCIETENRNTLPKFVTINRMTLTIEVKKLSSLTFKLTPKHVIPNVCSTTQKQESAKQDLRNPKYYFCGFWTTLQSHDLSRQSGSE